MNFKLKNPNVDKDSSEKVVFLTYPLLILYPIVSNHFNKKPFYKTHPTGSNSYTLLFNFLTKNKSIFSTTILMVQIDNFLKLKEKVSKLKPRQILQLEIAVIFHT